MPEPKDLGPTDTGLLIQILRGLDSGMPESMRPMWDKMTPDFQKQKMMEQEQMEAMRQQLQQGGSEADPADAAAELLQYRRSRQ